MVKKHDWQERKVSLGGAIVSCAVFLAVGLGLGIGWNSVKDTFLPYLGFGKIASITPDWSALDEVYSGLKANYDGEIDDNVLIEGAKTGLVDALGDKYTVYMSAEEATDFNKSLHGDVGSGVGLVMGERDGYVRVIRTLPDNPAREAGILSGDILYKVDDEEV